MADKPRDCVDVWQLFATGHYHPGVGRLIACETRSARLYPTTELARDNIHAFIIKCTEPSGDLDVGYMDLSTIKVTICRLELLTGVDGKMCVWCTHAVEPHECDSSGMLKCDLGGKITPVRRDRVCDEFKDRRGHS